MDTLFLNKKSTTHFFRPVFLSLVFGLSLTACNQTTANPKDIANQYWQQLQAGNTSAAEKLATVDSQQTIAKHQQRISDITALENGETKTTVTTTITTTNPETKQTHSQTFDTVLVLEQGQWKVDANRSKIPPSPDAQREELEKLAEELSKSMQENMESIDETVTQGLDILNEKLRESSKEMGGSFLEMMKELNRSMKESIDKMKKQKQSDPTKPDPSEGEGVL